MIEQIQPSEGVQALVDRIRNEGVQAAQQQSEQLLHDARRQAAQIIGEAKADAAALRKQTLADINVQKDTATAALRTAGRDTIIALKTNVVSAFERYIQRLVSAATLEPETLRCLILVLAGHAVDEFIDDKSIQVRLSTLLFSDRESGDGKVFAQEQNALTERTTAVVLGLSADMLREGIELVADEEIHGGAYVKLVDDDLAIDLSDQAITQLILRYLSPRFQTLLEGVE